MESLPVELLRRIATFSSYPTICCLASTSRKIRAAVHDWQVYKAIIDSQIHLFTPNPKISIKATPVSQSIKTHDLYVPPWSRNPINSSMSAATAAKYACVDYKAYNLPTKMARWAPDKSRSFFYQEPYRNFVRWGGVLVAGGHPLTLLLGHTDLLCCNSEHPLWHADCVSPIHRYMLIFCMTAYLLSDTISPLSSNGAGGGNLSEPTTHFSVLQKHSSWLHSSNRASGSGTLPQEDKGERIAFGNLESWVQYVGLLGWNYRRVILDGPVPSFRELVSKWGPPENGGPTEEQAAKARARYDPRQLWGPPVALGIPFEKYMNLEEQLGGDGEGFVWCHLAGMMNQKFLEEGRWMGFYTYGEMTQINPAMVDIDPAMVDIVFTVVDAKGFELRQLGGKELSSTYVPIITVEATGKDSHGDFVLQGKLFPKTGYVQLEKTYYKGKEPGRTLDWAAYMTPFGIVGRWESNGSVGNIWLWKEDWYGDVEGNELANRFTP